MLRRRHTVRDLLVTLALAVWLWWQQQPTPPEIRLLCTMRDGAWVNVHGDPCSDGAP